jgi:hypothetical protein
MGAAVGLRIKFDGGTQEQYATRVIVTASFR